MDTHTAGTSMVCTSKQLLWAKETRCSPAMWSLQAPLHALIKQAMTVVNLALAAALSSPSWQMLLSPAQACVRLTACRALQAAVQGN